MADWGGADMIRMVLITTAFFCVTILLLVMQPAPDPREPVFNTTARDVTRSETTLTDLHQVGAEPPIEPAPSLSEDALGFGLADSVAPENITTENTASLPAPGHSDVMASLSGLATNDATPVAKPHDTPLERLVIRALKQGQSEAYIDALVNDAARKGRVHVPSRLVTSEGRVDTQALISVLQARIATSGPGGTYTVEPGDTLAAIAYRYYGTVSAQDRIFNANRDKLNAPDQLTAGLELFLPAQ